MKNKNIKINTVVAVASSANDVRLLAAASRRLAPVVELSMRNFFTAVYKTKRWFAHLSVSRLSSASTVDSIPVQY